MKKLILGMALFAGSFALANEPIENYEVDLKIENKQLTTRQEAEADCACELVKSPEGTCTVIVMHGDGSTTTYGPYSGHTPQSCKALKDSFAPQG